MCWRMMKAVSNEPVVSLELIKVINGAFIFSTTFLKRSGLSFDSLIIILTLPSTNDVEDSLSLSHKIDIISKCSCSVLGTYLERIYRIWVCSHSLYYFSRLYRYLTSLGLSGIPPSEMKISSKAATALQETNGSPSLMSEDNVDMIPSSSMLMELRYGRWFQGHSRKPLRVPW